MNNYINQNCKRNILFLSPASLALGQGFTILQGGKESQQAISTANFNDLRETLAQNLVTLNIAQTLNKNYYITLWFQITQRSQYNKEKDKSTVYMWPSLWNPG